MVKEIAALSGVYEPNARETTNDILRRLVARQFIPREVADVFHALRRRGNAAAHEFGGSASDALSALKFCRTLGVWYRRTYGRDPDFSAAPFVPPANPEQTDEKLQAELEALRQRVRNAEAELASLNASAEELAKARQAAEELARQASAESAVWEETALENETTRAALERQLRALQSRAEAEPDQQQLAIRQAARQAAGRMELDEADTRVLIDVQLTDMGWEADTATLRYARGTRPEKGRNLAIAEWPTGSGNVDYALFAGLACVGIIEAKREPVTELVELQQVLWGTPRLQSSDRKR